jgi:hypothetical protein
VNLLGNNLHNIKKNTDILIDTSKEAGVEEREKTNYVLLPHHHNTGKFMTLR